MPFMLKPCGHALRYSKSEGICGRCNASMDVEDASHDEGSADSDVRMNAENVEPVIAAAPALQPPATSTAALPVKETTTPPTPKKPFQEQVEKLLGNVVNSEGSEINDAVTHVARNMSTFTAGERGDFVHELVIKFCEARREDQPKIDSLLKELAKKNVLAKPHFLQSAKRIVADSANLAVDWPNIYDCTVNLIGTNLSLLKSPTENLEALAKILKNAHSGHAPKYLLQLRRYFPAVLVADPKTPTKPAQPRAAVGFLLSPAAVKDKFIRPVGQRPPRQTYSRAAMLAIEANWQKYHPAAADLKEKVQVVWRSTARVAEPERDNVLKRPRFVSESGGGGGEPAVSTKRMLESTSPPLILTRAGADARFQKDSQASPSSTGPSLTGYDRPRYMSESVDKSRGGPSFPGSPKKSYHEHPYANHPRSHEPGTKPRYNSFNAAGGSPKAEHPQQQQQQRISPPRQPPVSAATAVPATPPPSPAAASGPASTGPTPATRPGSGKTKKFLTALNVERIAETDTSPLSPTLSPGVKTWSRGSGSLNTTLRPGLSGGAATSPSKGASAPMAPRTFGTPHHNNHHHGGSRGSGPTGDHHQRGQFGGGGSLGAAAAGGDAEKMGPEPNWRRGLSQA